MVLNFFLLQVIIFSLVALTSSQYQKPSKDAAIVSEARYLAVNGQFGASYKQEDGVEFKEESDGQGNRRGSYSYVDPTGIRRTTHYTAGRDGFKATGDHIPVPPAPLVASALSSTDDYNYNEDYDESPLKNYQSSFHYNNYQFVPRNSESFSQSIPHKTAPQYSPLSQFSSLQLQFQPSSASVPTAPTYNTPSTESPLRFLSPGKLSLNRSPDGFSYTFNKI